MKAKNTVEKLIEKGEIILLDPFLVRAGGLGVKVGMITDDHKNLEVDKAMTEKKSKRVKTLINSVAWTIFRCQRTGVKANSVVRIDALGWPPLAMGCFPFNATSKESVIVLSILKEVAK